MKFIKNLIFDMKYGTFKNIKLFLLPIGIATILFVDVFNKFKSLVEIPDLGLSLNLSWGDFLFYTYGGMKEYIPNPDNPFKFPTIWIVVYLFISFILLNYPIKDMNSVGSQVLLRSNSRVNWWLSKCMWNILSTVIYHGIILFVFISLCFVNNIPLINEVDMDLQSMLFRFSSELGTTTIPIMVIVNILLVSVFTNLLQMVMSLFVKPVFSFLAVAGILLSSSYLLSPFMIGNYGMILRYNWLYEGGVSPKTGILSLIILILITIIIGLVRFKKYDILYKD